jgi:type IV pilus assembly protein PilY1
MYFFVKLITITLLVLANISQPSWAEDIEIYRGQSIGVRNNAVFVMDTSGSMGWYEDDVPSYNSETDYDTYHSFQGDLFYYSNDSISNITDFNHSEISTLKQQFFYSGALVCKGILENLESNGFYNQKFKRWNESSKNWEPTGNTLPTGSNNTNELIECQADGGLHGIYDGDFYINTRGKKDNGQYNSYDDIHKKYTSKWDNHFKYLYSGNFLNYKFGLKDSSGTRKKSRMKISTEAAISVVESTGGIRLGLMRFDSKSEGGFVDIAVDDIENIRTEFKHKINNYLAWGGTPLSETYYEAAMYFRGKSPKYGNNTHSQELIPGKTIIYQDDGFIDWGTNKYTTEENNTPSVSSSKSGSQYLSPINSACQEKNSLILFTDGEPSNDTGANTAIKNLIKDVDFPSVEVVYKECIGYNDAITGTEEEKKEKQKIKDSCILKKFNKSCSGNGDCANELAYYLSHFDQNKDLAGVQIVKTSVIGGFFDENDSGGANAIDYMQSIATAGKGEFHFASDGASIAAALGKELGNTSSTPSTFVAPAVAANSFNSLEHLDQLYYAMFVPASGDNWSGNLKSYRLSGDGKVLDSKGNNAIIDGVFTSESRSYWTDLNVNDGASVLVGGAASRLNAATTLSEPAKIYTYLGHPNPLTPVPLTDTLNKTSVTKSMLGLNTSVSDYVHQAMIDWGNRVDSSTGVRRQMEDPLHSRPLVVTYNRPADSSGNIVQDGVVFVGTNSGYLHAFKADKNEFKDYFSFIPKELLKNIPNYIDGEEVTTKTYGVDGPINYWHTDFNKNGQVDIADGEKIFLFFGLRRGGEQYYALDITNPDNPKFAWQINGGTADFKHLGQTWSNMTLAKVPWNGSEKVVLIFGAGYDSNEDERTSRATNSHGKAIYIVDAEFGTKLWDASPDSSHLRMTAMTNSVTADITPVDYDGDSMTDYFFANDVGGKIWRFDINKNNSGASDFAKGGLIFDANGDSGSPYQRFYYAPSIAYFSEGESSGYLAISIGSGFRAHPLESGSEDSFYILKDYNVTTQPQTYTSLTPRALANLKGNSTDLQKHNGWKLALATGEKALSKSLTANGDIYFTTFSPTSSTPNPGSCTADIGNSHAYVIDLKGDNDPHSTSTGPIISDEGISSVGIPAEVIEIRTTKTGDLAFCDENPGHEKCFCIENPTADECQGDPCDNQGSVILSGTLDLGGGKSSCDLVHKDYWTIQ